MARLGEEGLRPPLAHALNSAGLLAWPAARGDLVRPGIALYGLSPSADLAAAIGPTGLDLRPVLSWKTQIGQVHRLEPGDAVGYGATWRATRPSLVATIPVGYADGFRRAPRSWRQVLVRGCVAPLMGRVSMDQSAVDVTGIPGLRQGDEVVLIRTRAQRRSAPRMPPPGWARSATRWSRASWPACRGWAPKARRAAHEPGRHNLPGHPPHGGGTGTGAGPARGRRQPGRRPAAGPGGARSQQLPSTLSAWWTPRTASPKTRRIQVTADLSVLIRAADLPDLVGTVIDLVTAGEAQGFAIRNPNPVWRDPLAAAVQAVVDRDINPGLALHGGGVSLLGVEGEQALSSSSGAAARAAPRRA